MAWVDGSWADHLPYEVHSEPIEGLTLSGPKFLAGPKFFVGEHSSHLFDPVGTVDTHCDTCMALWDLRVHALAASFAAQLEKDCPELGQGLRQKVLAAWFKTTAQE